MPFFHHYFVPHCFDECLLLLTSNMIKQNPHSLAGQNASFEVQFEEKASSLTWLKDNKPLDDRLADRFSTQELDGNYYQLNIKHCW